MPPFRYDSPWPLLKTHVLLDITWDDLRTAICSLRSLKDQDEGEGLLTLKVSAAAFDPAICSWSFEPVKWELSYGSLHVLRQILHGKVDGHRML